MNRRTEWRSRRRATSPPTARYPARLLLAARRPGVNFAGAKLTPWSFPTKGGAKNAYIMGDDGVGYLDCLIMVCKSDLKVWDQCKILLQSPIRFLQ